VLPTALYDVQRVRDLPVLLAVLLALLAAVALTIDLFATVRAGRRDLGVLKVIGFAPRQAGQAVAWVAVALTLAAVLLGVPLGIAAGQRVWRVLADRLGVGVAPVLPFTTLLLVAPCALLVAGGAALVPARLAARASPGRALRTG